MRERTDDMSAVKPFMTAETVHVCKECEKDIWPGDTILTTQDREPDYEPGNFRIRREILCEDCGKLYLESQELGQE